MAMLNNKYEYTCKNFQQFLKKKVKIDFNPNGLRNTVLPKGKVFGFVMKIECDNDDSNLVSKIIISDDEGETNEIFFSEIDSIQTI